MSIDFGNNNSFSFAQIDSALIDTPPWTAAGWFYSLDTTDEDLIFAGDKDVNNAEQFRIMKWSTNMNFRVVETGASSAITSNSFSANTWHHFCGRAVATDSRIMTLDGDHANQGTNTTPRTPAGIDRFCIGRQADSSPNGGFNGRICDVGLWSVSLTDDEVSALAAGADPRRIRPQSLIHYWTLYNASDLTDLRGGVTLSLGTAPSTAVHHGKIWRPGRVQLGVPAGGAPPVNTRRYSLTTMGVG